MLITHSVQFAKLGVDDCRSNSSTLCVIGVVSCRVHIAKAIVVVESHRPYAAFRLGTTVFLFTVKAPESQHWRFGLHPCE
jgi:hypothetical protein